MTALAVLAWGLLCLHWLGLVLRQAKQMPELPDYDCFVVAFFALIFLAGSAFFVVCNAAGAIAFDLATR